MFPITLFVCVRERARQIDSKRASEQLMNGLLWRKIELINKSTNHYVMISVDIVMTNISTFKPLMVMNLTQD